MTTTKPKAKIECKTYQFEWSDSQWDEIDSLVADVIVLTSSMPRKNWILIAQAASGKAELIRKGYYPDGVWFEDKEWRNDLTEIADVIMAFFQPGDGKL